MFKWKANIYNHYHKPAFNPNTIHYTCIKNCWNKDTILTSKCKGSHFYCMERPGLNSTAVLLSCVCHLRGFTCFGINFFDLYAVILFTSLTI